MILLADLNEQNEGTKKRNEKKTKEICFKRMKKLVLFVRKKNKTPGKIYKKFKRDVPIFSPIF
jgi:hypothetical protein